MIDIGSYAFMRKLAGRMNEIDLSDPNAKETMRSYHFICRPITQFVGLGPIQIHIKRDLLTETAADKQG